MAAKKTTEPKVTEPKSKEQELLEALEKLKKEKESLLKEVEDLKSRDNEPIPEETEEKAEEKADAEKAYWSELVPYEAFYDGDRYSDDIIVVVHDKRYLIKRGERVMIPRFVKHVLDNAEEQKRFSANYERQLQRKFERETEAYLGK
ncbi:MAG: hypothetical protein II656_07160 [Ruminococcus sp.]|nr:hypothetical protein [Ruminococcus sp.]